MEQSEVNSSKKVNRVPGESQQSSDELKEALSIGAVAQATGIGVETLRMWERRYGAPCSVRLPSGHRRYPLEEVERLKVVAEALEFGYRAREVAATPLAKLEEMVERARRLQRGGAAQEMTEEERIIHDAVDRWLDTVVRYDEEGLNIELYREWGILGPIRFLTERVKPFLERLGTLWLNGELAISHEHFGSERVNDFLAMMWRRQNERTEKAPFLVASLPGDLHRLGLQMCALIASLAEHRVIFIGPQTPPREIVRACEQFHPTAICLSISITMDQNLVRSALQQLRLEVPESIAIVTGGNGAPEGIEGILYMPDLQGFYEWALER